MFPSLSSVGSPAKVALDQGDHNTANVHLAESLRLAYETENEQGEANALRLLGFCDLSSGDLAGANKYFRESLAIEWKRDNVEGVAACLEGAARLIAARDDYKQATRLIGFVDSLRDQIGVPLSPVDEDSLGKWKSSVRKKLGEGAFKIKESEGRSLTMEGAIEMVMKGT